MLRRPLALAVLTIAAVAAAPAGPAGAAPPPAIGPTAVGFGGAVASVDPDATRVGIEVLRRGGNAVDAAVATAAALGVTEPFSSGIGGGGFFVFYDARRHQVHTIDGREAAPASMGQNAFINPATGAPFDFQEARVSGISVGVPGTPATWASALQRWGTISFRQALQPAIRIAQRGFLVDATFNGQVASNLNAFGRSEEHTSELQSPS